MKKTKIIATIGPASCSKKVIRDMIKAGMDIARINMSYSSHEELKKIVNTINELNKEMGTYVATMVDTNGPEVLVGKFEQSSAMFTKGDKIRIYMSDVIGDSTKFSVNYPLLIDEVKVNTTLKVNDGLVELLVIDKDIDSLVCEVVTGGEISDNKKVNVIGIKLELPFLSKKDKKDIAYASELHVDYVALSFVSTNEDVLEVNDMLINLDDAHMNIISKIENVYAVDDIDEIIKVSDGVMVARGDLGVELPLERIPGIQKSIISKCHYLGKVSIVATEMMTSMENRERPTRAEVSDVANAVLDGADDVMLAGETTIGNYPVEVIDTMAKILESAEEDFNYYEMLDNTMRTEKQDTTGAIAYSVVECGLKLKCSAIVTPTMSGYTARKLSRFRPNCPIIAMSPDIDTVKSLNMYYGVYPILIESPKSFDKVMDLAKKHAIDKLNLSEGERIIITGGYPFKEVKHTNFMKIEDI